MHPDTPTTTAATITTTLDGDTAITTISEGDTTIITSDSGTTTITDGDTTIATTTTPDGDVTTHGDTTAVTTGSDNVATDEDPTTPTTDADITTTDTDTTTTITTTDSDTTTDTDTTTTITTTESDTTVTETDTTTITTGAGQDTEACVSLEGCEEVSVCRPSPLNLTLCRQCNTSTSISQCPGNQRYSWDTHLCVDPPADLCSGNEMVVSFRYDVSCSENDTTPPEAWIIAQYCETYYYCFSGQFLGQRRLCTNYFKCYKEGDDWRIERLSCSERQMWNYEDKTCVPKPSERYLCRAQATNRLRKQHHRRRPKLDIRAWNT
ncbi:hypothetical protein E2C01_031666 [Portunus trituberculatus]|uniref:Chitin-binding type-2 domain-containing protein n=1 Tax=Portunus trituberculatus TaxID=210409 RepID=A0A5B7EZ70_PORTR|nr:hypothetical protein [Portunus trituberculatus]